MSSAISKNIPFLTRTLQHGFLHGRIFNSGEGGAFCTHYVLFFGRNSVHNENTLGQLIQPGSQATSIRNFRCKSGVFKLYLLRGHILMAEKFAGRIHVLQSKVCVLLQDSPTDISLHKRT
jgi:hypothetical protein